VGQIFVFILAFMQNVVAVAGLMGPLLGTLNRSGNARLIRICENLPVEDSAAALRLIRELIPAIGPEKHRARQENP